MENKQLAMFIHLSKTLHFGKTAQVFHVSPSTLSRQIQRLEQHIGCPLLHRDNRSVKLTDEGIAFRQYAVLQQQQWHEFKEQIHQRHQPLTGQLSLYCSVTAAYSHLPPLLEKFRQQHPQIEIILTTGDAADAHEQLQQQQVDIAIATQPEKPGNHLYFLPMAEIELVVIAPTMRCKTTQLLEQQSSIDNLDWPQIPLIMANHGTVKRRFEHWYLQRRKGKPNIYARVAGHEAIVSMVALGCGIAMVPLIVMHNSPVKERIQVLQHNQDITPMILGVCCLNRYKNKPVVQAFLHASATNQETHHQQPNTPK